MKQLCGKTNSNILYSLVFAFATVLSKVLVQCSYIQPSAASLVAEIIQSTREISISFSGVTDNAIYSQVSNSYQPYTIDAVKQSNLISGVTRIHVASNVTGKYSELFRENSPDKFFLILEPKKIIMTNRERDSRNFVIINQGKTLLSTRQGMTEIREPETAYRHWNAMMNSDTESRITATCISCRPKVQEFVKSIAGSLSVDDMFYGSHLEYYKPMLVFMNRYEPFDQKRLEYSPFLIGHDELAFALPLRRRQGPIWWVSFIEQYLFPWEPQVWYSVGLTWLSAAVLFMLTGLVLMKKRTFYYTGRKLLEVMAVIRFPLKKDSWTGKGAAVVLKTGLSIVFIAYVQLLIKENNARTTGEDHILQKYDWDTICRLDQDSYDIMGPRYFMERLRWKRQSRSCYYQRYDDVRSGSKSPVKDSMDHFDDALGECQRRLLMGEKVACFGMKSVLEDEYDFSDYARIRILDRWELRYLPNYEVQITAQPTCSGCRSHLRNFNRLMEAGIYLKFDKIYEEGRSANAENQEGLYRYHGPIRFSLRELGRLFDAWAMGLSICSLFFIVEKIFSYRPIFSKTAFNDAIILSAAVLLSLSVTMLECFNFAVEYWPNLSAKNYIPMYSLYGSHIGQHFSTYVVVILSTLIKTNVKDRKLGVIFAYIDKVIWILVTFSWVGFAFACWWFSVEMFNYRAFPALLVAIFTPIN